MNEHGNQIPILTMHKIRFESSTLGTQKAKIVTNFEQYKVRKNCFTMW